MFVADELSDDSIVTRALEAGVTVHIVGWQIVKAISDSVTPQGMIAVCASPLRSLPDIELSGGLVVVLAGVGDPGNVGTLIRTAAAASADAVVLTEGSADPLNPKTARASAAALFGTTLVADVSLAETATRLTELGYRLVGTDSEAPVSLYDEDLSGSVALVLGNESWGLPKDQEGLLDTAVSIPMPGPVESLNVATAGSVVVFEILRQKQLEADGILRRQGGSDIE